MKMAAMNFTSKEYGRRFRKALSVPFIFDQACSPALQQFVKAYADSIGCNEKCVLFPLLSCCAACIGPNSSLELAPNWQEPLIIWTLVLTPMTLQRIDVAEHIKRQLLIVQNELGDIKKENSEQTITKFVVDDISIDNLQEMLKVNDGRAFGLYNNTRSLHNVVNTSRDIEIMHKLHSGSAWFSNSKMAKKLLLSTHFNVSVLSNPSSVHHSLTTMPNFQELYHDCFLIVCAEENHVKFSQLNLPSQCENLQRIFKDIITLHSETNIVYKLNEEASAKFSQIHDEITDKAKQLARKNSAKVFYPALSYLARLSCIIHVLDNVLEAINFTVPVDPLTWNSEINADTVWRARQVLGYVIEQKFVLSQPTMVESSPAAAKRVEPVTVVDGPINRATNVRSNLFSSPQRSFVVPNRISPISPRASHISPQRPYHYAAQRGRPVSMPMQRTMQSNTSSDASFDLLFSNTSNRAPEQNHNEPMISEVRSAGVPVPVSAAITPVIESVSSLSNGNGQKSSVSMSVVNSSKTMRNSPGPNFTPQSVALMSEDDFLHTFRVQVRRLLMCNIKDMPMNRCIELEFAPKPLGVAQSVGQKTAMARIFLKRIETLGFGLLEGSNDSNLKHCVFKKQRFGSLSDKQCRLLSDLRINERDYEKCFRTDSIESGQNGIVCLE